MLEWKVDHRRLRGRRRTIRCARTYNFLQTLTVPGLALEDERRCSRAGLDPYDNARAFKSKIAGRPKMKKPGASCARPGFCIKSLAMTYSRVA